MEFKCALLAAVSAVGLNATVVAQPPPDPEEVQRFEQSYLQALEDGNVNAQLALVSRSGSTYSILDGEVWHGWEAVKAQAEAYVPVSKLVRNAVDKLEVVPLGPDAAIVVVQLHSVKRNPSDTSFPDMTGVLTHVLQRTPEGWRMRHEHFSTKLTPEFIAFQARLQQAKKEAPGTSRLLPPSLLTRVAGARTIVAFGHSAVAGSRSHVFPAAPEPGGGKLRRR